MLRLQAAPVTTNAAVGGFGMNFCSRDMRSLDGRIRIASAPRAGTTVTLEFQNLKHRMYRSYQ